MDIKLSICIVTDSKKELLRDCLVSIFKFEPDWPYEIVVIDNASSDSIYKMVKKRFPKTHVVLNSKKQSFSHNMNRGIRKSKGEIVLILNDDTVILDDSLNKMIRFLDENKEVGAAGLKQYLASGKLQYTAGRNDHDFMEFIYDRLLLDRIFAKSRRFGFYNMSWWDHQSSREVKALSGACMFVRKEIFDNNRLFDENFVFYLEDLDLCRSIREDNWQLWYNADCSIIHYQGMSIGRQMKARAKVEEFRSNVYYFQKHQIRYIYWLMKSLELIHNVIKMPVFMLINPKNAVEFIKVIAWHLRHFSEGSVLKHRY